MDKFSKEIRSKIMSKIKGKNTAPEVLIFSELKKRGIYFKKHGSLLGNPDIVFPKNKIVVFIDGDFWHGFDYEVRKTKLPDYWVKKIKRNIERDRKYRSTLRVQGWKVLRIWEHQVLSNKAYVLRRIIKAIQ